VPTNPSVVKTATLNVDAKQFFDRLQRDAEQDGGFLDFGGTNFDGHVNAGSDIYWESKVIILPSPNPELTIAPDGTITRLINVVVKDDLGTTYSLSQQIGLGRTIAVQDIINGGNGTVNFNTNNPGSQNGMGIPTDNIWGNAMVLQVQHTWDYVHLDNQSDRAMVVHQINVVNLTAATTVNVNVTNMPLNTGDSDGHSLQESPPNIDTFEFIIVHTFPATQVRVRNLLPGGSGGSPTLTLDGPIYNPIGTTTIINELSDILAGGSLGIGITTNILYMRADNGSIGCETGDANCSS